MVMLYSDAAVRENKRETSEAQLLRENSGKLGLNCLVFPGWSLAAPCRWVVQKQLCHLMVLARV